MDFRFTPDQDAFRREVAGFLEQELPDDWALRNDREEFSEEEREFGAAFRKKLADRGWLTMAWPRQYGGQDASALIQTIYMEEMSYRGAPGAYTAGTQLVDENGEAIQLKGVSSMWLNWEEDGYAEDPVALRWMRNNWNLSVIRAAMGVDPGGAYLDDPVKATTQVQTIVDNAIDAGVYVIIDFHSHGAHLVQDKAVEFFSQMAQQYADVPNVMYEPFIVSVEPLSV